MAYKMKNKVSGDRHANDVIERTYGGMRYQVWKGKRTGWRYAVIIKGATAKRTASKDLIIRSKGGFSSQEQAIVEAEAYINGIKRG